MPWRRRRVTEEQGAPVPRRPLIWPWLAVAPAARGGWARGRVPAHARRRPHDPCARRRRRGRWPRRSGSWGRKATRPTCENRASSDGTPGTVLSQAPAAGTKLDRGEPVTIVVARGPGRTDVPRVVGLPRDAGLVRLQEADLKGIDREDRLATAEGSRPASGPAPGTDARKARRSVSRCRRGRHGDGAVSYRFHSELGELDSPEGWVQGRGSRAPGDPAPGIVVSQKPAPRRAQRRERSSRSNVAVRAPTTTTTTPTTPKRPPGTRVPNVVGLAQRVAVARLQSAGFRVDSYPVPSARPRGTVIAQGPPGGARAAPQSVVRIDVSLGSGRRTLRTVPDVVGMTEAQAKQVLVRVGFTVRSVDQAAADRSEKDVVLDQRPAAGGSRPVASQVIIVVGRFPPPTS